MKTATCTHCGKGITWDEDRKEWLHDAPNPHTSNLRTCVKIEFATPRRGSIQK